MADRITGTVKFFNMQKGWGFIIGPRDVGEVFFHGAELPDGIGRIADGQKVSFTITESAKGLKAVNLEILL